MTWKKGQSGNPNGRPDKKDSLTELMREFLKGATSKDEKVERRKEFIEKVYQKAVKEGDPSAIKLIWNYLDGMPQQKVDHTTQGQKIDGFNYVQPKGK